MARGKTHANMASADLPQRVRKIVERALSLVSEELDFGLSRMLADFDQELFRLADQARNPGSESGYMQTLRNFRLTRADLIPRFLLEVESSLAQMRSGSESATTDEEYENQSAVSFHNLSLVEDSVMDEGTVLREIASRQEGRSTLGLHLLGQRFGVLAASPAFNSDNLPLGPQSLCRAIGDSAVSLDIDHGSRLLLYRTFDRHVMAGYSKLLDKINDLLIEEGILPDLVFVPIRSRTPISPVSESVENADGQDTDADNTAFQAMHRRPSPQAWQQGSQASAQHAFASAVPSRQGNGPAPGTAPQTASPPPQPPGGYAGAAGYFPAGSAITSGKDPVSSDTAQEVPGTATTAAAGANLFGSLEAAWQQPYTDWPGEPPGPARTDDDNVFASLQKLLAQRRSMIEKLRNTRARTAPGKVVETDDVMGLLKRLQQASKDSANIPTSVTEIKSSVLAESRDVGGDPAGLSPRDSDTFDLLSLVYREIEKDMHQDAQTIPLIHALQIPLLRLALMDREFFVAPRHPARLLLNLIAESAAKWVDKNEFDPQLLQPMQTAVKSVVEGFDQDPDVFAKAHTQLQKRIESNVRKAMALERRHIDAARGKEKLSLAKIQAASTLTDLMGEHSLSQFVSALMHQAWGDVLTLTLLRQGEDSVPWRRQLEITRKIILACREDDPQPIPDLIGEVEAALGLVGYHGEEARVVARRLTCSEEEDPTSNAELATKLKQRTRLGEDGHRTSRPKLPPRTESEQAHYDRIKTLPFGTWIEFVINQQGDVTRRRLSWYSPITDTALFVNQRGQRVGEHSLDSLSRMFDREQARIVTARQGHIVDRAWHAAIEALRSLTGRPGEAASPPSRATQ